MRNLLTELLPSVKGKFHLFADDDHEFRVRATAFISAMMTCESMIFHDGGPVPTYCDY